MEATIAAGAVASAVAAPGCYPVLASKLASSSDWTIESKATAVGWDGEIDPQAEKIFAVA
jgi:hypothetical protein